MMQFFIKMMSGDNGPSSKRGVMIFCLLLFAFQHQVDTWTGKHPTELFSNQLFEILCLSLVAVFGEKFINVFLTLRGKPPIKIDDEQKPAA